MFAKQLKYLRELWKIRQEDLADVLNVEKSAISQYETGKRVPDIDKLSKLADYFGVTVDYLLNRSESSPNGQSVVSNISIRSLPLLETIHAGLPLLSAENWTLQIEVPPSLNADFALRVKGDALSWVGIHAGDIVLLEQTSVPTLECILAVGLEVENWQPSLHFYIQQNGKFVLRSAHPEYEDIPFTDQHKVIGRLLHVIKESPTLQQYHTMLRLKEIYTQDWCNAIYKAEQYGLNSKKTMKLLESVSYFVKNSL